MSASVAFVFPGQGSQKAGMGKAWAAADPAAASAFAEADAALGEPLSRLCFEGPEADLQLTRNTQPAILAVSVAIHRAIADEGIAPVAMAGHSLGEYSAHVAAGSLAFADALRLVRRRGELMQAAVPVGEGAMAAILGLAPAAVREVAVAASDGAEVCAVANYNSPEQTVIAGHRAAVERAMALAKQRGAKRALALPVSAPFHSPLMRPAREGLEPLLRATVFREPEVPVVCNVDAAAVESGAAACDALVRQVDGPVRWVESVERLAASGVSIFVEIGPGAVLSGLIKRIVPGAQAFSLAEPAALGELRALRAV
ncbi:MAG: ACP S-malonyltransferase [Acidobacteriota bacterium]